MPKGRHVRTDRRVEVCDEMNKAVAVEDAAVAEVVVVAPELGEVDKAAAINPNISKLKLLLYISESFNGLKFSNNL